MIAPTTTAVPSFVADDAHAKGADTEKHEKMKMRVTLLSGFLGAGKTTLLKRILRLNNDRSEKDRLRMAVVVNDMGEINLDADEIKSSKVIQEDAEMVEMHNGCICCTLRGDLLKTVKSLSEGDKFDYLVIESTGIGEPLPVAQTFVMDVDSMEQSGHDHDHEEKNAESPSEEDEERIPDGLRVATDEKKSLFHYAMLDTLVTVVDACNIFDVLSSIETLADEDNITGMLGNTGSDTSGKVTDEQQKEMLEKISKMELDHLRKLCKIKKIDKKGSKKKLIERLAEAFTTELEEQNRQIIDNRPISRLWLDQIEFANVIVVSKAVQFLENRTTQKLKDIEILLKKLNPKAKVVIPMQDKYQDLDVTETLINTGLFDFEEAQKNPSWAEELVAEHNPETEEYGISSLTFIEQERPFHPERLALILTGFGDYESANESSKVMDTDDETKKFDAIDTSGDIYTVADVFKGVVRTKGNFWLANANAFPINFQSAGTQIDMRPAEQPFLAEIKHKVDTQGFPDSVSEIEKTEFMARVNKGYKKLSEDGHWTTKFGDRRSQLVFIGVKLDKAKMRTWLTKALVSDEETEAMGGWENWKSLSDPFYGGKIAAAHFSIPDNY